MSVWSLDTVELNDDESTSSDEEVLSTDDEDEEVLWTDDEDEDMSIVDEMIWTDDDSDMSVSDIEDCKQEMPTSSDDAVVDIFWEDFEDEGPCDSSSSQNMFEWMSQRPSVNDGMIFAELENRADSPDQSHWPEEIID